MDVLNAFNEATEEGLATDAPPLNPLLPSISTSQPIISAEPCRARSPITGSRKSSAAAVWASLSRDDTAWAVRS